MYKQIITSRRAAHTPERGHAQQRLQHDVEVVVTLHIVHAHKTRHVVRAVERARPRHAVHLGDLLFPARHKKCMHFRFFFFCKVFFVWHRPARHSKRSTTCNACGVLCFGFPPNGEMQHHTALPQLTTWTEKATPRSRSWVANAYSSELCAAMSGWEVERTCTAG